MQRIIPVSVAIVALLSATTASAATACESFTSYPVGASGPILTTLPGGAFKPYRMQFVDLGGVFDLEITDYFIDRELRWSYGAGMTFWHDLTGKAPSSVEFDVYVHAEPIVIIAYDEHGNIVAEDLVELDQRMSYSGVRRVELWEGDNETWIDDVCATW